MTRTTRLDLLYLSALLVAAVAFLPGVFGVEVPFLNESVVYAIGAGGKLLFLILACLFAADCGRRFDADNPARLPWAILAVSLGSYSLGQSSILYYQLVLKVPIPFPSVADAFFLAAMVGLIVALVLFLVAFRRAGLLVATRGTLLLQVLATAIVLGLLGVWLLTPVVRAGGSTLETVLNLAYPISDLILMIPTGMLLFMVWRFSGGHVARVWFALLLGLVLMAAGDVGFAYLTSVGLEYLDPVVNFLFLASYLFLARATHEQVELLREGAV